MDKDNIQSLNIQELLSQDEYRIPIYQRNYDWGEKESLQLLEDIADYASMKKDKRYYIGSVVVFVRSKGLDEYYETIDGQQRLTTLTILMNVLCSIDELKQRMSWFKRANLSYDHRCEADEAIRILAEGRFSNHPAAESISEVYRIIQKNLSNILESKGIVLLDFVNYLLSNVIIMRIPVPRDTELNHYFEIMNSRGEQLEKHEVLKANLMNYLEKDKNTFNLFNDIWEACADMSTYVQMNMKSNLREIVFSKSWTDLQYDVFDSLLSEYGHINDNTDEDDEEDGYVCRSLTQLFEDADYNVKYELSDSDKNSYGGNDRFGSIINFPNFILQVLKVMYHEENNYQTDIDDDIKLDDKRLIDIFQTVLLSYDDKCSFVKRYIMALLKIRNLFDSFVVKRESYNGKEGWSLKVLKKYDSNVNYVSTFNGMENEDETSQDIRMLEAMFHVSAPTQIYKHWLNAILYYVNNEESIEPRVMRNKLYTLACTYMLDRYLCEEKINFETFIYKEDFHATNNTIHWEMIDKGCNVENFVFNFYDYLTWKLEKQKYFKFEFTYRTSVEHFYPQHAMDGYTQLDEDSGLHNFGNLCLISRGMNSKFSNNMPKAKFENFSQGEGINSLSLKLNEMMDVVRQTGQWSSLEINDFETKARHRLLNGIKEGSNLTDINYVE